MVNKSDSTSEPTNPNPKAISNRSNVPEAMARIASDTAGRISAANEAIANQYPGDPQAQRRAREDAVMQRLGIVEKDSGPIR